MTGLSLNKPSELRNRWREHYDNLNRISNVDFSFLDQLDQFPIKAVLGNIPYLEGETNTVTEMHSRKAPGLDSTNAELLKFGGPTLTESLHELYVSV